MTLTLGLDLDRVNVKVNLRVRYLGQKLFNSKLTVRTHRRAHTQSRLLYWITKSDTDW